VSEPEAQAVLQGGGEMGARMRAFDWSTSPVGPVESWPQSLRSAMSICLGSRFPICLYWGPELATLYNDAWSTIPGSKHPAALGKPAREVWPDIWDTIAGWFDRVIGTAESIYQEGQFLAMHRHGYTEECYFDFTFTPIRGESGRVEGVFNAVIETTPRYLNERRTRVLRDLAEATAPARTPQGACARAAESLGKNTHDVPFCALYLSDEQGSSARLIASAGLPAGSAAAPSTIAIDLASPWALAEASNAKRVVELNGLQARLGVELPGPVWPEPTDAALIAPLLVGGKPSGYLVLGVNPRRAVDDDYRLFAERAALHVASAIATANDYERQRKRADELVALDRAKTVFFSNVSHEFRTPLTLMLGPTHDVLSGLHGQVEADQRAQLEVIHRNGLRLQKLVDVLLDFSRLEAGRVKPSYEPTDLPAFTSEIASAFEAAVQRAGLSFVIDCPPLPELVYVDREMWSKIVLNLISNALKFTFEGKIEVALHARGNDVALRVSDTGVGIAAQNLPRVFERFHRVEGTRARTHEGSGIGLALVHELAKLHGGSVVVESALEVGTTFTVSLPQRPDVPKEQLKAGLLRATISTAAAPFVEEALRWLPGEHKLDGSLSAATADATEKKARILLADDNGDMREYLEWHLSRHWNVEAVEDGLQALDAVHAHRPDLIVTDIMMPGLDGFGLLRELRNDERTREIPVVMLSARSGEEAKVEGLQAGAEDYLTKPFSSRELIARVQTHLELAGLRRAAIRERDRLRSLLGHVPAIIDFLRGPDLIIEYAHPLTVKTLGGRDIVGKPLLEAIPELQGQAYPVQMRRVFETGERLEGREQLVRLDLDGSGNLRETYWNYVYVPVRDQSDNVEGVMAFSLDVTDQVLARRRVEESEDKFRRLVAQVEAGIAQTDLSGRFVFTNERYREIVGRSEAELLQLRMQDITHVDDLAANLERFARLVEHGSPFAMEKRYVKPDGSIVWVQNSVSRIDDPDGTPQGTAAVTLDITERMAAERARQESEERFRNMADSSPVMVWVTEPDGRCSYLSKSWYEFTGQTPETGLGFGWLAAVHPDDAQRAQDMFVAANARGEGFRLEYRLRGKDGAYRYAIDSAAPRLGAAGEFLGFIGSVIDIDERRKIEDRLAALQVLTARLVDASSSEEVADVAISGSAVIVGASAGVFYSLPEPAGPAQLVAQQGLHIQARPALALDAPLPLAVAIRTAETVWLASQAALTEYPGIDKRAAKIKAVVALPLLVEKAVIGGFALSFEHEHALGRADRDFLESVAALCAQALLRISAIERERQAREATRRSEARYREIFEGAEVSLWEEDFSALRELVMELSAAHGSGLRQHLEAHPELVREAVGLVRVLDINPATLRLLGAQNKSDLLETLHQIFLPETLTVFAEEMVAIAEGQRIVTAETVVRALSGERVNVAFTAGFPAGDSGWDRVHVTLMDISAQKLVEREREARVEEMERAVRFSELFVGILGHDLRNPLSAITTAANLLETRADSDKIAKPASRIVASADRMERMISQLLDFTRIRLGRGLPLDRARVNLGEIARTIIEETEPVHRREIKLEKSGDLAGMWDRDRLSQLLSNLAANACQHGGQGSPILISVDGSQREVVQLEVKNSGAIPQHLLPVVFEPLRHSGERHEKREGSSGLGLGLYITRQIALAHGGAVRVESTEARGTRFVVELPRYATEAEENT
jgi:PAS domain S-box-containing protein